MLSQEWPGLLCNIPDDARPNVSVTALTSTFFILEWTLPQTAMGNGISTAAFNVQFDSGSPSPRTSPLVVDSTLITITGTIVVRVQPVFSMPVLDSSNTAAVLSVTIPSPDNGKYHQPKKWHSVVLLWVHSIPLCYKHFLYLAVQPILNRNSSFSEAGNVTVSWPLPTTTMFLEGYLVTYNVTNLVSGSVVTSISDVTVAMPRISIDACPYCLVVVDVDAFYGSNKRAPLLLTSRYITRQARKLCCVSCKEWPW